MCSNVLGRAVLFFILFFHEHHLCSVLFLYWTHELGPISRDFCWYFIVTLKFFFTSFGIALHVLSGIFVRTPIPRESCNYPEFSSFFRQFTRPCTSFMHLCNCSSKVLKFMLIQSWFIWTDLSWEAEILSAGHFYNEYCQCQPHLSPKSIWRCR